MNVNHGIYAGFYTTIERCIANSNGGTGIHTDGTGGSILDCTARANTLNGIYHGGAGTISRCSINTNIQHGIESNGADSITNSTSWANSGCGFLISSTSITNCHAQTNGLDGFRASSSSTITACTALSNSSDGFEVGNSSIISNCTAASNNAGIRLAGTDIRIEANNATDNTTNGILVPVAGNIFLRNVAYGNATNYSLVAGNFGLFVNANAAPAVNGSFGGAALGSTDPSVNFSY
ncbi:MAG: right-handed parallel beta-helix repeat-containing protein [Phycisphaerales bacterium]|nr:right-handed parallel beta-helix repeat-containing protein [Phycisphaerales bacterium]